MENKQKKTLAHKFYFGLGRQLKRRTLCFDERKSRLLFSAETWTLANKDKNALDAFQKVIPRKIDGPVCVNNGFRRRCNGELNELFNDIYIVKRINIIIIRLATKQKARGPVNITNTKCRRTHLYLV